MPDYNIVFLNKFNTPNVSMEVYRREGESLNYLGKATQKATGDLLFKETLPSPQIFRIVPVLEDKPHHLSGPYNYAAAQVKAAGGFTSSIKELNNTDWEVTLVYNGAGGGTAAVVTDDPTNVEVGEHQ